MGARGGQEGWGQGEEVGVEFVEGIQCFSGFGGGSRCHGVLHGWFLCLLSCCRSKIVSVPEGVYI